MANWMSRTAPSRVSLESVPSSTTVMGRLCPLAQRSKCVANLWFETTTYSSTRPQVFMSSSSQSRMVLSPTFKRGLGKFSVRG